MSECTGCGVECDSRSEWCRSCSVKAQWANGKISNRTPRVIGPCPECGEDVVYSGYGAPKFYCSQKCNMRVQNRRSRRRIKPVVVSLRACSECGETFAPKRAGQVYCSKRCYYHGNPKRPKFVPEQRTCNECGAEFTSHRYDQRFCQTSCARKFHVRAHMNRSRTEGVNPAYVDRDIFERDGWICWLCNEPVDPTLSRRDPLGATVDHVVPLSRGGADEPENLRLAHYACNNKKSTRLV